MSPLNPGALRELVRVQAFVPVRQPGGGHVKQWTDIDRSPVWAEIRPLSGTEYFRAMQTAAQSTHRVRLWAIDGLTANHRLVRVSDNRVLDIVAPPALVDPEGLAMQLLVRDTMEDADAA